MYAPVWLVSSTANKHDDGLEVDDARTVLKCITNNKGAHQGNQLGAAEPIIGSGRHGWQVGVLDSFHDWGDGLVIGAMDGAAELSDPKGVKAWGLHVFSGCVHVRTCVEKRPASSGWPKPAEVCGGPGLGLWFGAGRAC